MEVLKAPAAALAVLLMAAGPAPALEGAAAATREYDLKAAFLFNFAQFVEWPAAAFPDAGSPITICVLGEDPLGGSLDAILKDERVRDRRLVARRHRSVAEADLCHMVFVGASEESSVDEILDGLRGRSILTVGETDRFSAHAGMIRFAVVDSKVRLRINVEAAREAGLAISSKLLRLAEIVSTEPTR